MVRALVIMLPGIIAGLTFASFLVNIMSHVRNMLAL